jgi:phospholipid N-methyltransferase
MNKINFLQGFLRSPLEVGSIIPSSRFMVRRVADHVVQANPKTIVELGAGTGVFTRELNQACGPNTTLIVFEKDQKMREQLNDEFPHLSIYSDALSLSEILDDHGIDQVDCIVCGLPFSLFPVAKTEQIFEKIHLQLKSNGCFIMYQYSTQMKKRLKKLFDQVSTELVLLNLPPTFVYFCKKL